MSETKAAAKKVPVKVKELEAKVSELTQALQIERADAINLRRRHEQELSSIHKNARAHVIEELLPVIDNLDRALRHVPDDLVNNTYVKGIEGIIRQFEKTLFSMGLEKIKSVGEHFDPNLHEAISLDEGNGDIAIICEELQAGYKLNGEVIRHAIVKIKMQ
jgi:molecular chaperone GrpE